MIWVKRYSDVDKDAWNEFNNASVNNLFMFNRNYMDYHKDRFKDYSLLFYSDNGIIALFPACEDNGVLVSHGGLTYGGFLFDCKMKQHTMNDCFEALISYMNVNGIKKLVYKTIPYIYHLQPAEEDRYALYKYGAKIVNVDASTAINLSSPLKMSKGRKAQISRARREGVEIAVLTDQSDFDEFINLENSVLQLRHNTNAVHSSKELKMLQDRFPDNIHLYAALRNNKMIAGTVIYEYKNTIHTQYMAANDEARTIGALDLTVNTIIEKYKNTKLWLDFGISTEHHSNRLNEGLISQKEGFGGRTIVYDIWELEV